MILEGKKGLWFFAFCEANFIGGVNLGTDSCSSQKVLQEYVLTYWWGDKLKKL